MSVVKSHTKRILGIACVKQPKNPWPKQTEGLWSPPSSPPSAAAVGAPPPPTRPQAPWPQPPLLPHVALATPSVHTLWLLPLRWSSPPLPFSAGRVIFRSGLAGLQPREVGRWGPQGVTCTLGPFSFGDCPLCPCLSSCNKNSCRFPVTWEIKTLLYRPSRALLAEPRGHRCEALSTILQVTHQCCPRAHALCPQE